MSEFEEGLYDQLVTERLRQSLESHVASGVRSLISALEEIDCPDYLARHTHPADQISFAGGCRR